MLGKAGAGIYPEREAAPEGGVDRWARTWVAAARARCSPTGLGLRRQAAAAQAQAGAMAALDDAALREAMRRQAHLAMAVGADAPAVAAALACVREVAWRSLGLRPYPCQLMAASALLSGRLAEMSTGEGKSLTAALAAAIGAAAGVPVHVVTVNDYLAERDADDLRPLFAFLGLRVGTIVTGLDLDARRAAYACDITYCTNKELVFDYLKDRVASAGAPTRSQWRLRALQRGAGPTQPLLLRGLHMAIVDEADSVLIDEARTPLILAQVAGEAEDAGAYQRALALAAALQEGQHFLLVRERRELRLTEAGRRALAVACAADPGLWQTAAMREPFVEQALRARWLFLRDQQYIVADGEVQIVDEFTGRVLPGRTWERGLQQLVEVKEGCALSRPARTLARITYQRFFGRYLRLAGMTGTAAEVAGELREVYALETVRIPLHRPSRRRLLPGSCFADAPAKWQAVADEVRRALDRGQPVLVGTRSVQASEALSAVLAAAGIDHQLLNARQDADEAAQVARAGEVGRVTVATNMAGRGTDIRLVPAAEAAGGLHVVLTEYHTSPRIDRQLLGRCARQGDRGSAVGLVALDDELLRDQGGWLRRLLAPGGRALPGPWALHCLRWFCQGRAARQDARVRRQTLKQERQTDDSLAFAGQNR